jgi:hypothetical protein
MICLGVVRLPILDFDAMRLVCRARLNLKHRGHWGTQGNPRHFFCGAGFGALDFVPALGVAPGI